MARHSTIIRILVVALAVAALSAPAAWADRGQPLLTPAQSTEHGSSGQPLIVPVRPSTEHGGTVAVQPAVIVQTENGFDWRSAGIGALGTGGLALGALGASATRGRRPRTV